MRSDVKKTEKAYLSYREFIKRKADGVTFNHNGKKVAVLLSTSGSTGVPKKVELTSEGINSVALQYPCSGMRVERNTKILSIAPYFLAVSLILQFHMPMTCGIMIILNNNPAPEAVAESFVKYKPNYFMGALEHILKIVENTKTQSMDLSKWYVCMLGGEGITEKVREKVDDFLLSHNAPNGVLSGYGMTEVSAAAVTETNLAIRKGSVGLPMPLVNVKVRDLDDDKECGFFEQGEIMISSPGVMLGYYDNPEETADTIEVDEFGMRWCHTGDLGYIDEDGYLFVTGRIKRIFTTLDIASNNTYKFFPDFIEGELEKISIVARAAVISVRDDKRMHVPVAFVQINDKDIDWEGIIKAQLKISLPLYAMPEHIYLMDKMPLLSSGKIDYKSLEQYVAKM